MIDGKINDDIYDTILLCFHDSNDSIVHPCNLTIWNEHNEPISAEIFGQMLL